MNNSELRALLIELTDPASDTGKALAQRYATRPPETSDRLQAADRQTLLRAKLETDERFAKPLEFGSAHSSVVFLPDAAASGLLERARIGGADAAVQWLSNVFALKSAPMSAIQALTGIRCRAPICLTQHISLVPFEQLPDSRQKEYVGGHPRRSLVHATPRSRPDCALMRHGILTPPLLPQGTAMNKFPQNEWFRELELAVLVLSLVPDALPADAGRWMHSDNSDLREIAESAGVVTTSSEINEHGFRTPPEITAESVQSSVSQLLQFKEPERVRLATALSRFARCKAQLHPGNRAIDLATAYEILTLSDNDQDELKHRISLRVARLLRSELTERQVTRAYIKALYDIRSVMVHRARIADKKWRIQEGAPRQAAHLIVDAATALFAEMIIKILGMGAIPDWDAVELQ